MSLFWIGSRTNRQKQKIVANWMAARDTEVEEACVSLYLQPIRWVSIAKQIRASNVESISTEHPHRLARGYGDMYAHRGGTMHTCCKKPCTIHHTSPEREGSPAINKSHSHQVIQTDEYVRSDFTIQVQPGYIHGPPSVTRTSFGPQPLLWQPGPPSALSEKHREPRSARIRVLCD